MSEFKGAQQPGSWPGLPPQCVAHASVRRERFAGLLALGGQGRVNFSQHIGAFTPEVNRGAPFHQGRPTSTDDTHKTIVKKVSCYRLFLLAIFYFRAQKNGQKSKKHAPNRLEKAPRMLLARF